MFEKVNPAHPDKIADRIAGALVDVAYKHNNRPIVAIEVLIGHGFCYIMGESSHEYKIEEIQQIVDRIAGKGFSVVLNIVKQDEILAENQKEKIRCGDNGIFKGVPITEEQKELTNLAYWLYTQSGLYDGKYIVDDKELTICQSNTSEKYIKEIISEYSHYNEKTANINPLGEWQGGPNVDTGATNRKLGSDMGDAVTGGGLHGKDLSKADISVNIYAHLCAQYNKFSSIYSCAIGDDYIDDIAYEDIVTIARLYIQKIGGFEKFAEWGLIRP